MINAAPQPSPYQLMGMGPRWATGSHVISIIFLNTSFADPFAPEGDAMTNGASRP